MLVRELFEGKATVWSTKGTGSVRKYRCTSGIRKGRVMASPSSCNKPLNVHKSVSFKQTKKRKGGNMQTKISRAKRINPGAIRTQNLNKALKKQKTARRSRIK